MKTKVQQLLRQLRYKHCYKNIHDTGIFNYANFYNAFILLGQFSVWVSISVLSSNSIGRRP